MSELTKPRLSIVVVVYRMSRQADNTLFSLSTRYQTDVDVDQYEVIVVENESDDILGERRATAHGANFRYFLRAETSPTPVHAVNFGLAECRAPYIGLVIDGARIASPGVVANALLAQRIHDHPLAVVPGYHLGDQEHNHHLSAGHNEKIEQQLLDRIEWKRNGYDLFTVSCISSANPGGPFCPFLESNCIFATADAFEEIGGADERFDLPGGGSVNLHLYRALASLPRHKLVVMAGEGTFHQFHGGITTAECDDRESVLEAHRQQLKEINGGTFKGVHREPTNIGVIHPPVIEKLQFSATKAWSRSLRRKRMNAPLWTLLEDEPSIAKSTSSEPAISVLVPLTQSRAERERCLYSLSVHHQRNIDVRDYEIVVVDPSDDCLTHNQITQLGENIRLVACGKDGYDLKSLLLAALQTSHARQTCVSHGSCVVTPRLIEHALLANRTSEDALTIVPHYQLHSAIPVRADDDGGTTGWTNDGYVLFDHLRQPLSVDLWMEAPKTALCFICHRERLQRFLRSQDVEDKSANSEWIPMGSQENSYSWNFLAGEGCFYENSKAARDAMTMFSALLPKRCLSTSTRIRPHSRIVGVFAPQIYDQLRPADSPAPDKPKLLERAR